LQNEPDLRKRVCLFWGPEPLSFLRFLTVKSLCDLNPGWKVQLTRVRKALGKKPWVEHNRQDFEAYDGRDYWAHLNFPNLEIVEIPGDEEVCSSHQSNFFKWKLLSTENCIYSDMDILYVKPLDTIYDSLNSCDMSINHNGEYFSHGFMSSKKYNFFFSGLYSFLIGNFQSECYQGAGSNMIYAYLRVVAPEGLAELNRRFPNMTVWNFPERMIYPWGFSKPGEYFKSQHMTLPEECIGLHWYAGSPMAQMMNKAITSTTIHILQNTVCYHARKLFK